MGRGIKGKREVWRRKQRIGSESEGLGGINSVTVGERSRWRGKGCQVRVLVG